MMTKIRLARFGKHKRPYYRIVVMPVKSKRDGQALDILGTYDPLRGELVQFHADRLGAWIEKGAIVSPSVKKLQKMHSAVQA